MSHTDSQNTIKVSVKTTPLGKPLCTNGSQLTYAWQPAELTPAALVAHICTGKPFAVAHYRGGHRAKKNFVASSIIGLDLDSADDPQSPLTDTELDIILCNPFVQKNAFAIIESFNSCLNAYRLRILFALSEVITDAEEYAALVKLVQSKVPFCDAAAKDAGRAFYGGQPGRQALWQAQNWLDVGRLREELARIPVQTPQHSCGVPAWSTPDLNEIRAALAYIPPQQSYDDWLRILMAVHSAYPSAEGVALIEQWSPGYEGEVAAKFRSFSNNQVGLGTLFHLAKQMGYQLRRPSRKARRKSGEPSKPRIYKPLAERASPFNLAPLNSTLQVNLPYISEIDLAQVPQRGLLLIKSQKGSGKTELLKRLIDRHQKLHGEKPRVIVPGPREALSRHTAQRLGISCYKDIDDSQLPQQHSLTICLNSLYKLIRSGQALPHYQIIFLDEVTQLARHLDSATFKTGGNALKAYDTLKTLIRSADLVCAFDADLDDISRQWLEKVRGESAYSLENTYRQPKGDLHLYANSGALILQAQRLVVEGKRIAVACGSKQQLKALQARLGELINPALIQAVHGDNSLEPSVQDFTNNINEAAPHIRVLLYTSSYGTGIDITAPFDAVLGIFGRNLSATEIMQMLGRCRRTHETHLYICPVGKGSREEDPDQLYTRYLERAHRTGLEGSFDQHGIYYTSQRQNELMHLLTRCEAEDNRSRNQLLSHVVALAQDDGYTIMFHDKQAPEVRNAMARVKAKLSEKLKKAVLNAAPIDFEQLEQQQRNGTLTPDIRHGHQRYVIEDTLGQVISPRIYDDLHSAENRHKLRLLTSLRQDEETLHQLDREEALSQTLLKDRQHHAMLHKLVSSLLEILFEVSSVDALLNLDLKLTDSDIRNRTRVWLLQHGSDIEIYIDGRGDLSRDPKAVIRRLLARAGIHLDYERVRLDGQRIYRYFVDKNQLARWLGYSDSRITHLKSKKADLRSRRTPVSHDTWYSGIIPRFGTASPRGSPISPKNASNSPLEVSQQLAGG